MCGQFGVLTTSRQVYADDFISDAFVTSMLRGVDSSGIVSVTLKDTMYELHKLPVNGLFFKEDRVAKRIISDAGLEGKLSMCHVRAATVGTVNVSNAHPFAVKKDNGDLLMGTHNGTLNGWRTSTSARNFDVDSEWALSRISEEGIEAFKDFAGAYAFVWWDASNPDILHMARNNERPLYVALLKGGGLAYASEGGMLFWLIERNNMKVEGNILSLDPDHHYMFPVKAPEEFTKEKLPKKEVQTYINYSGTYSSNTSTTYMSCVDGVKKIIEEMSTASNKDMSAHPSEQKLAREYGWLGERAVFTHLEVDSNGDCVGMAETFSTEFEAIIRGDKTKQYDPNEDWLCTVVGAVELGDEIKLILSEPYRTMAYTFNMEE